jgi:uncharacterized RDD family membrane protein YckC
MDNLDEILDAPEAERIQLEYAGFLIRVGAYIIDAIILWAIYFVVRMALGDLMFAQIGTIINLGLGASYFALMESSRYQATVGKMAVSIQVGDRVGGRISILNAFGRYFAKMISALLLCIGFLMVGWDDKSQGLHDKLADTYVFYGRNS